MKLKLLTKYLLLYCFRITMKAASYASLLPLSIMGKASRPWLG